MQLEAAQAPTCLAFAAISILLAVVTKSQRSQLGQIPATDLSRHALNAVCCGMKLVTHSTSEYLSRVLIGELHILCR